MNITAHLASVPERALSLCMVLKSIFNQVDHIYVALNGYLEIPTYCEEFRNVIFRIMDNSLGDAAKFAFLPGVTGLVLICDDDLQYSSQYVRIMRQKVMQYNCPCSLHGKVYPHPVESYKQIKENYHCLNGVVGDHRVDIIGTGTLVFDTSMVKLSLADFPIPNMADVWFSKLCWEQDIPMMAVEHKAGFVRYIRPQSTIWHNTKDYSNHVRILNNFLK